jgi:hypothetical protein
MYSPRHLYVSEQRLHTLALRVEIVSMIHKWTLKQELLPGLAYAPPQPCLPEQQLPVAERPTY